MYLLNKKQKTSLDRWSYFLSFQYPPLPCCRRTQTEIEAWSYIRRNLNYLCFRARRESRTLEAASPREVWMIPGQVGCMSWLNFLLWVFLDIIMYIVGWDWGGGKSEVKRILLVAVCWSGGVWLMSFRGQVTVEIKFRSGRDH